MAYDDYASQAEAAANAYGVPWPIFRATIDEESGWNANIISPAGAIGLTQLMPGTASALGVNPYDATSNLNGGAQYLRSMFDKFGTWANALAAYNSGPAREAAVLAGTSQMPAETQSYVPAILSKAKSYGYDGTDATSLSPSQSNPSGAVDTPASSGSGLASVANSVIGTMGQAVNASGVGGIIQSIISGIGKVDQATTPANIGGTVAGVAGQAASAAASSVFGSLMTSEFWQKNLLEIAVVIGIIALIVYGLFRIAAPSGGNSTVIKMATTAATM